MNMKHLKKAAAVSLAALAAAGMIAGCGGEKKASAPSSQPAAQTVKINFPTAGASGALYAVGAAITNMWNNNVPGVQAASQASAGVHRYFQQCIPMSQRDGQFQRSSL